MKASFSKRFQFLLLLISILLIGLVFAIFAGYRFKMDAPRQVISAITEKTAMTIENLRQTATRDGVEEWRLSARSARLSDGGKEAALEAPFVIFFSKDQGRITLTANQGRLHMDSNDFEMAGNIEIRNKFYQLHTEKLQYHHKGRIIVVDSPVEIAGNRMNCKAARMTFDLNTNKTVLQGKVQGSIIMRQDE